MGEHTVTAEQFANFLRKRGKYGQQTIEVLNKHMPFVEAIETEIGRELLKDAVGLHEALLMKVADLTATPEETMEYKAVRKILLKWSERIAAYNKEFEEIQKG